MIDDAHIPRAANRTSSKTFFSRRKLPNFALYPRKESEHRTVRADAICNSKRKVRFPDAHRSATNWHVLAAFQNLMPITRDRINRRILTRYELTRH